MGAVFKVAFNGRYIEAVSLGQKTLESSRALWAEVVRVCAEHDCYFVLGISYTDDPIRVDHAFDHAELFGELGIDSRYRISWAESNSKAVDSLKFADDVLYNRGLPGRVFGSVEDARNWLVERLPDSSGRPD